MNSPAAPHRLRRRSPVAGTALLAIVLTICCAVGASGQEPVFGPPADLPAEASESFAEQAQNALAEGPPDWVNGSSLKPQAKAVHKKWKPFQDEHLRIRGRIDADLIGADQSAANRATYGDLDNVVGLRRARIGVEGHFTPDSHYVAEIDLATGQVVIRDLLVGVGQISGGGEFRAGHMREPFSLEGGISANSFAFMERSPINTLDPARNWGVGFSACTEDEDATFAMGLFSSGTDSNDFERGPGSDSSITGRWTWLPWHDDEDGSLMHFGLALSSRIPDPKVVIISQGPNSPLLDFGDSSSSPFVPKISVPATFEQLFNVQWAYADGPFWTQAEWYGTWIDQIGGPPVFFHGSYLSAGYFLTGEHRNYLKQHGFFGPVKVDRPLLRGFSSEKKKRERGYGAWEVTGRVAYLDFMDSDTPAGPAGQIVGTNMPQATVGLNWYLADQFRILFNYTYSAPDEPNTGTSSASVFGSRLAIFW
jgi:phosphate-selective porin OprO/OprP